MREQGDITILEPWGGLDAVGARDLERAASAVVGRHDARIAIDCARLERVTGPGLRALVALSKRVSHRRGRLVLFALDARLTSTIDVAGLSSKLESVSTEDEALAHLSAPPTIPPQPNELDLLAKRVMRALGGRPSIEVNAPAVDEAITAIATRALHAVTPASRDR